MFHFFGENGRGLKAALSTRQYPHKLPVMVNVNPGDCSRRRKGERGRRRQQDQKMLTGRSCCFCCVMLNKSQRNRTWTWTRPWLPAGREREGGDTGPGQWNACSLAVFQLKLRDGDGLQLPSLAVNVVENEYKKNVWPVGKGIRRGKGGWLSARKSAPPAQVRCAQCVHTVYRRHRHIPHSSNGTVSPPNLPLLLGSALHCPQLAALH